MRSETARVSVAGYPTAWAYSRAKGVRIRARQSIPEAEEATTL